MSLATHVAGWLEKTAAPRAPPANRTTAAAAAIVEKTPLFMAWDSSKVGASRNRRASNQAETAIRPARPQYPDPSPLVFGWSLSPAWVVRCTLCILPFFPVSIKHKYGMWLLRCFAGTSFSASKVCLAGKRQGMGCEEMAILPGVISQRQIAGAVTRTMVTSGLVRAVGVGGSPSSTTETMRAWSG